MSVSSETDTSVVSITITINGVQCTARAEPRTLLVRFIRENLNLTGTHIGCDITSWGLAPSTGTASQGNPVPGW